MRGAVSMAQAALGAHIMEQLTQALGSSSQASFAEFHASVKAYLEATDRRLPP